MTNSIATGPVHNLALTVTNVRRSVDFYSGLLGFKPIMELGPRVLLFNGSMVLAITPPPDATQAPAEDRFNENASASTISALVSRAGQRWKMLSNFGSQEGL
jgi:catechol 2,3-dioxygenase-like lactoylglutathione lyase family enzyme